MRLLSRVLVLFILVVGCGNAKDVVFGPNPIAELEDPKGKLKDLKLNEKEALKGYLLAHKNGETGGLKMTAATGRIVNDVLFDSVVWRESLRVNEALERVRLKDIEIQRLDMELKSSKIRLKNSETELQEIRNRERESVLAAEAEALKKEADKKLAQENAAKAAQARAAQAKKKPTVVAKKSNTTTKKAKPKKK